jgi:hypothetical protein
MSQRETIFINLFALCEGTECHQITFVQDITK